MTALRNVVLVGSGWARHAVPAVLADPSSRLVALVARGSARSQALASQAGIPLVRSVDELPADVAPHVAVVAVGEQVTPLVTRTLLGRGCDVLCAHPVAPSADEVRHLVDLATQHGRRIGTDYTLHLVPGAVLARKLMADGDGPLLRLVIEHPARLLPMALQLALFFAGPVRAVLASRRVPVGLEGNAKATPAAFSPSLLLEHDSGVVSSLSGVTHAPLVGAFRCTLSGARGRLDLELPQGTVSRVRLGRQGAMSAQVLTDGDVRQDDPFGALMQTMVASFLRASRSQTPVPCPLSEEVQVRAIWNAIPVALRSHARAFVELAS
jgi:predicted dehydrogenase